MRPAGRLDRPIRTLLQHALQHSSEAVLQGWQVHGGIRVAVLRGRNARLISLFGHALPAASFIHMSKHKGDRFFLILTHFSFPPSRTNLSRYDG